MFRDVLPDEFEVHLSARLTAYFRAKDWEE
jgi:hypothetical protein